MASRMFKFFFNPYGHQRTVTCTLHGVPTLCEWEVARSLTLSSPFWIAVNTARSSCAIISEILVFREPRVWMSCCACVVRMSRGFSVSWSISHCRKGFLIVYVTPIQLLCVCVYSCYTCWKHTTSYHSEDDCVMMNMEI